MIDLHAHILPGVDDGAFDLEETLNMARMAVRSGVTAMAATPHCNLPDERYPVWSKFIVSQTEVMRSALQQADIPLQIYCGMEIYGTLEAPRLLREGMLHTLNSSRYPLVEFPFYDYAEEATAVLDTFVRMGYRPIVAHPERYAYVQETPQILNIWTDLGCLLQLNRGSLLGRFGRRAERLSYGLIERGFATCIASDAHTSTVRTPWLKDVYDLIGREYSFELADLLMKQNPKSILGDHEVETEEPEWF